MCQNLMGKNEFEVAESTYTVFDDGFLMSGFGVFFNYELLISVDILVLTTCVAGVT